MIPDVHGFRFLWPAAGRSLGRLRAVRQYYTMPDAATQAMIAAMGDTIEIIPNPNPSPASSPISSSAPAQAQQGFPAPVYPSQLDYMPVTEQCGPMDPLCIARNLVATTNAEVAFGQAQADAFRAECVRQGIDPTVCAARWPAGYIGTTPATNVTPAQAAQDTYPVGRPAASISDFIDPATGTWRSDLYTSQGQASAVTGQPNQSVPPRDTSVPMPAGTGPTAAARLVGSYAAANAPPPSLSSSSFLSGDMGKYLLLGLGAVALLMVVKK